MNALWIVLGTVVGLAVLILLLSFVCFMLAFYSAKRKPLGPDEYRIPDGKIYEPYRDKMVQWQKEMRALPQEDVEIRSFDGLTLRGKYFESAPGAPLELMMHGYRGSGERDMCGGVPRAFSLGRNVLMIDQRAAGRSDGYIITFGIRERYDGLEWLRFIEKRFGPEQQVILTGISMGAATVMLMSEMDLPKNVVGILADCGYSSAKDIMMKVIRQIHLPARLLYPFVRLGARLWGGFDIEEASPIEAVKRAKVPIIFIHGESDDFVPCEMSRLCYEACSTRKQFLAVPGAGHGLAFPVAPKEYLGALGEFFGVNIE